MANLTITLDKDLLKRARIKAIEEGTSVNAVLRDYLERYAGSGRSDAALAGFAELAGRATSSSGPRGRTWTRDRARALTAPGQDRDIVVSSQDADGKRP